MKDLEVVIADSRAAMKTLDQQFQYDERDMKRYLSLLHEQNDWLFKYVQELEKGSSLGQRNETRDHGALLLEEQKAEIEKDRQRVDDEIIRLQDSIAKQRQVNESLVLDEQRLEQGIKDIAQQVDKAQRSVSAAREDAFGEKRKELEKAMSEQTARLNKVQSDLAAAKKVLKEKEDQKAALSADRKAIEEQLRAQQQAVDLARIEHDRLEEENKKVMQLADKNIDDFKKEIQGVQMRKQALEASIDVAHKKYKMDADEKIKFDSDMKEMESYLEVLKRENLGLRNKVASDSKEK